MYKMADLLRAMMVKNASDMFITANATPSFKVDGKIFPIAGDPLDRKDSQELCYSIMNEEQRRVFEGEKSVTLRYTLSRLVVFVSMCSFSKAVLVWCCGQLRPVYQPQKS